MGLFYQMRTTAQGRWTGSQPVQLKELVSEDRNSQSSLQRLIEKVAKKYTALPGQEMLVVAITSIEQPPFDSKNSEYPKCLLNSFGFMVSRNNTNCFIVGNLLGNPARHDFTYPNFQIESPVSGTSHDE